MFYRNDDPRPLNPDESQAMHAAFAQFSTQDEVRFDEGTRLLAPILNTLTANHRKFYLVHLPEGSGWVLRRHRPTGVFHGRAPHVSTSEPLGAGDAPEPARPDQVAADSVRTGADHGHPDGPREFAEEYFGT